MGVRARAGARRQGGGRPLRRLLEQHQPQVRGAAAGANRRQAGGSAGGEQRPSAGVSCLAPVETPPAARWGGKLHFLEG